MRRHPLPGIGQYPGSRERDQYPDRQRQERPEPPPRPVIGEPRFFTDNPDIPSRAGSRSRG